MKVKEIYITKDKLEGQSDFSAGIYYVLDNGDIYERITTDMIESIIKSNVKYDNLIK